jgi:phospholipid/cholesterol/gamma-HCH transport system ATP-binding protein
LIRSPRMQPAEPSRDPRPPTPADVEVRQLALAFGERVVFERLSCRFQYDEISVILGGSGVGKSVLLRVLAQLERPDSGEVWVGDEELTSMSAAEMRRFRRRVGMMFQGGALLDSMTVFDNVALPLREHTRMNRAQIADAVHQQLEAVGLKDVDALLPGALSGGMKKRVALARAMINKPEILLIDEPLSGLDPIAVRMIEALMLELSQQAEMTMIITSHHISSTLRMADHIIYLVGGGCVSGSAEEIQRSSDPRLRAFLEAAMGGPNAGSD